MSWKLALFTALLAFSSADQYCRGLALGGGNDLGAFQAGAIVGLLNNLPAQETNYQIVTGLGVGAINALIVSKFNNSQNAQLENELASFWQTSDRRDFLRDWVFGRVDGYFKHSGLYDSSPMYKTIGKLMKIAPGFARPFHVGATDLISGNLFIFNNTVNSSTLQTGIYASASDFVEMPAVPYKDLLLVEGSVRYTADILGVINFCINQGYDEENIIVDTVFTMYSNLDSVDAAKYKTAEVVRRVAEIYNYNSINTSLEIAFNSFPDVNYRYTLQPTSKKVGNMKSSKYSYSKDELKKLYIGGQAEAADGIREA